MAKAASKPQPPPPITIMHGPERFEQIARTDEIKRAIAAIHGDVEPVVFDGAQASAAEILDECRSLSLMQSFKLVIVENTDQLLKASEDDDEDQPAAAPMFKGRGGGKTAREVMQDYAARPEPAACLILRAPTWKPGKLDKAVLACGGEIHKCEEPSLNEAATWAKKRATEKYGVTLEPAAAERLVMAVGAELGRLDGELAKLSLVEPGKPITEKTVAEMTGASREEEFWAIQPSLLSGDVRRALTHLHELLEISRLDPTPLTFTYMDLAKKLHGAARGLKAGENPFAIAGRLKLWGPAKDVIMLKARSINPAAAARLMGDIVDSTLKARTGLGDPVRQLEGLTIKFASLCRV